MPLFWHIYCHQTFSLSDWCKIDKCFQITVVIQMSFWIYYFINYSLRYCIMDCFYSESFQILLSIALDVNFVIMNVTWLSSLIKCPVPGPYFRVLVRYWFTVASHMLAACKTGLLLCCHFWTFERQIDSSGIGVLEARRTVINSPIWPVAAGLLCL